MCRSKAGLILDRSDKTGFSGLSVAYISEPVDASHDFTGCVRHANYLPVHLDTASFAVMLALPRKRMNMLARPYSSGYIVKFIILQI